MSMSSDFHSRGVLIVGAGPTGLALANALAHYGVPFTIVDKKKSGSSESKGLTMSLGTQYGLEAIGLKDEIGKRGYRIKRASIYWEGQKFAAINFAHLRLPVNTLITQPQPNTEREFQDVLRRKGFEVSWNTSLTHIEQSDDSVTAAFEDANGESFSRVFDYAVGCEGKNSIVRESIGAVLDGCDYSKYLVLGDFPVSKYHSEGQIEYHVFNDTFFILIPIGGGLLRVVVKYEGEVPGTVPTASEITSIVNRHMGDSFLQETPVWLSRAQLYMRTTDRLRKGRLFIAGDAAHLVSPIGGTGFNMGIQDSLNLAWKIAYRYFDYADEKIFDAYERERLDVIRETVAAADLSTKMITGSRGSEAAVDELRPLMKNRNRFRNGIPLRYSGLGVRYSKCYAAYNKSALEGARLAGEYCFARQELLKHIAKYSDAAGDASIIVVVYLSAKVASGRLHHIQDLKKIVKGYDALAPLVILYDQEEELAELGDREEKVIAVPVAPAAAGDFGFVAGSVQIVMPDGYIVYSGNLTDSANLEDVLVSMLSLKRIDDLEPIGAKKRFIQHEIQL